MRNVTLACAVGALVVIFGGYFAYQTFRESVTEAANCLQEQDFAKKIDGCTQVINRAENSKQNILQIRTIDLPTAYFNRGYAYQNIAKADQARENYKKAIELQPNLAMAYNNLAALDLQAGYMVSAGMNLSQAINIDQKLNLAWDNLCALQRGTDKYSEALKTCTRAIELSPSTAKNFVQRGSAYLALGDNLPAEQDKISQQQNYKNALSDFDTSITLSPGSAVGHSERCRALISTMDYAGAIASCTSAIKLKPDMALPYANRGLAYLREGDASPAIADFDKAIQLDPKLQPVYDLRSDALDLTGDLDRALKAAQDKIAQFPDDPVGYSNRAIVLFSMGKFHAAAEDFAAAIKRDGHVYKKLWRYVSSSRAGEDATGQLKRDTDGIKDTSWPYPVVEFYLGQRDADAMMSAANTDDQRCEATFYRGEWLLLQHKASDAAPLLKQTIDTCPKAFVEYRFAQAELKRLAQQ